MIKIFVFLFIIAILVRAQRGIINDTIANAASQMLTDPTNSTSFGVQVALSPDASSLVVVGNTNSGELSNVTYFNKSEIGMFGFTDRYMLSVSAAFNSTQSVLSVDKDIVAVTYKPDSGVAWQTSIYYISANDPHEVTIALQNCTVDQAASSALFSGILMTSCVFLNKTAANTTYYHVTSDGYAELPGVEIQGPGEELSLAVSDDGYYHSCASSKTEQIIRFLNGSSLAASYDLHFSYPNWAPGNYPIVQVDCWGDYLVVAVPKHPSANPYILYLAFIDPRIAAYNVTLPSIVSDVAMGANTIAVTMPKLGLLYVYSIQDIILGSLQPCFNGSIDANNSMTLSIGSSGAIDTIALGYLENDPSSSAVYILVNPCQINASATSTTSTDALTSTTFQATSTSSQSSISTGVSSLSTTSPTASTISTTSSASTASLPSSTTPSSSTTGSGYTQPCGSSLQALVGSQQAICGANGTWTISGNVIIPGSKEATISSADRIIINGDITLSPLSHLGIYTNGTATTIIVSGLATIGGTLTIQILSSSPKNFTITIIDAASVSGNFSSIEIVNEKGVKCKYQATPRRTSTQVLVDLQATKCNSNDDKKTIIIAVILSIVAVIVISIVIVAVLIFLQRSGKMISLFWSKHGRHTTENLL